MSSDGLEEREFKIKLRDEIVAINALAQWIGPDFVLVRDNADALKTAIYKDALIVLHDFSTVDRSHAFGVSGELAFHCSVSFSVRNTERMGEPLPADQVGISEGPSIATFEGALRNAFHFNTLGAWCWNTDLGSGDPIPAEELPDDYVGRRYPFVAYKEVQR
jgi:hypothetical protein